jgi:hypothetical protein
MPAVLPLQCHVVPPHDAFAATSLHMACLPCYRYSVSDGDGRWSDQHCAVQCTLQYADLLTTFCHSCCRFVGEAALPGSAEHIDTREREVSRAAPAIEPEIRDRKAFTEVRG